MIWKNIIIEITRKAAHSLKICQVKSFNAGNKFEDITLVSQTSTVGDFFCYQSGID